MMRLTRKTERLRLPTNLKLDQAAATISSLEGDLSVTHATIEKLQDHVKELESVQSDLVTAKHQALVAIE
jgi:hypothetical protein